MREETQRSELLIPTIRAAKYPICMANPGIVIRNDFLQLLKENNITGYDLGAVRDSRSKKKAANLNQLIVTHQLKAVSDYTVYETRRYEETESINMLSEIIYEEGALQEICDLNLSQESNIFRSGDYLVDIPYLIVSKKLRDICKKSKMRTISFDPVHIIGSETTIRTWHDKSMKDYYRGGMLFGTE